MKLTKFSSPSIRVEGRNGVLLDKRQHVFIRRLQTTSSNDLAGSSIISHESTPISQTIDKTITNLDLQMRFFNFLKAELSIKKPEDWINVKKEEIYKRGGKQILQLYKGSVWKALMTIYPEQQIEFQQIEQKQKEDVWKKANENRGQVQLSSWESESDRRQFFEFLAKQLNIQKPEDWYRVGFRELKQSGASWMIQYYYESSLPKALSILYPDTQWKYWKFERTPKGFWESVANQRIFFDDIAQKLDIKSPEDWYNVKALDVKKLGGFTVLYKYYKNNLGLALCSIYPEYNWQMWRFERAPKGFWSNPTNVTNFLQWFVEQAGIKRPDDWYSISADMLPSTLLHVHGGLMALLHKYYPHYNWNRILGKGKEAKSTSKSQEYLLRMVKSIFPQHQIHNNYQLEKMVFPQTKRPIELDIYIPSLQLAFEYYGFQHFNWTSLYGDHVPQQQRDEEKVNICREAGITVIQVPYWWDHSAESLRATIHQARPELVEAPHDVKPIVYSKVPPAKYKKAKFGVFKTAAK